MSTLSKDDHPQHLEAGLDVSVMEKGTLLERERHDEAPAPKKQHSAMKIVICSIASLFLISAICCNPWMSPSEVGQFILPDCRQESVDLVSSDAAADVTLSDASDAKDITHHVEPAKPDQLAQLGKRQDEGNATATPTEPAEDPTSTETDDGASTSTEQPTSTTTSETEPDTPTLPTESVPDPTSTTTKTEEPEEPTTSDPAPDTSTTPEEPTSTTDNQEPTTNPEPTTTKPSSTKPQPTREPITSEEEESSSSAIVGTITSTLADGATTTLTSTSYVNVRPTAQASDEAEPDLQNTGARSFSGHFLALTVAIGAGLVLAS